MSARGAVVASAKALLAEGKEAEAASQLQSALAKDSCWGRGWLLLGQCHARRGNQDAAAVCLLNAGAAACDDASPALALAAHENAQLCSSRVLPRHAHAWLSDSERSAAWAAALRTALRDAPPKTAAVLCGGDSGPAVALHATLALDAGAGSAVAAAGSELVAHVGARALQPLQLTAQLPHDAAPFDVLAWDFGNRLDAASLAACRAARSACAPHAAVLPARVRVLAAVVECDALVELNAVDEVCITPADVAAVGGGDALPAPLAFSFSHFSGAYTRTMRCVQLQAASTLPWRVLTEPVELLSCRPTDADGQLDEGSWVDARIVANGCGHAVVTWLEVALRDGDAQPLCTAPPELSGLAAGGASFSALAHVHAAQYATFAPRAAPWRLRAGDALRLRGGVQAPGVAVAVEPPLSLVRAPVRALSIPDYHCSMLNDAPRNAAYFAGLTAAVAAHTARTGQPPRVLDIGAGAGLLSMLAARAGCTDVVACERDEALAATAAADIADNGFGDVVTVVAAHSRDLNADNIGGFDVIVSEVFGSDCLSEGVLPTLAHAQEALLAPGGVMVPARVRIRAALVCSGALATVLACGQEPASERAPLHQRALRAFDVLAPTRTSCHLPDVAGARVLSEIATYDVDFNAQPLPQRGSLRARAHATHEGVADAVLYYFEVAFDGGAVCATGPADGRRLHWPQTLFRLPSPRRLMPGDAFDLQLDYLCDRTTWSVS